MATKSVKSNSDVTEPSDAITPNNNGASENVAGTNTAAGNGDGNGDGNVDGRIDPTTAFGDGISRDENGNIRYNKDGSPRKKRGRKPGSGGNPASSGANKSGGAKNSQNLTAIETLSFAINGFHIALAAFTKAPELTLEDSESDALAKSLWNVAQQFDMSPDPRIIAIAGLIATSAQIYGPRFYIIQDRRKKEKPIDAVNQNKEKSDDKSPFPDISMYNFTGNA